MTENNIQTSVFEGRLRYLPTVLSLLVVAWFTLVPDPLPEEQPISWPGFDKIAHLLLMGYVTAMWMGDFFRGRRYRVMPSLVCVAVVILIAGLIEVLQGVMGLGRSAEVADIVAGAMGSVAAAVAWSLGRISGGRYSESQS